MSDYKFQSKVEASLYYISLGWPIFPVYNIVDGKCSCKLSEKCTRPGKHPKTKNGFYDASTDPEQIKAWWERWPEANIGVRAGNISGILILDVDGEEGVEFIKTKDADLINESLPIVKTGSGEGNHLYFKPFGDNIPPRVRIAPGIDIRGDGSYGILPPSDHISGGVYEWVTSPESVIPETPTWLKQLLTQDKPSTGKTQVRDSIPEGQRNSTLTSIAGTLRRRGLSYDEILAALNQVNMNRCVPPLSTREVESIAKSISRYDPEEETELDELNKFVEDHAPRIKLQHITEIENPLYLNKKIEVEAIVSSTSYPYARRLSRRHGSMRTEDAKKGDEKSG